MRLHGGIPVTIVMDTGRTRRVLMLGMSIGLIGMNTAMARMGETKAQLEARYGTPVKEELIQYGRQPGKDEVSYQPDHIEMVFDKNNIEITALVYNDTVEKIEYRAKKSVMDDIIFLLLDRNTQGFEFISQQYNRGAGQTEWMRSDGGSACAKEAHITSLTIESPAYKRYVKEGAREEQRVRLEQLREKKQENIERVTSF